MKRRMLTIALALLLAAGGTAGILVYVHQASVRAINGLKAVTVLVAGNRIPSGTSADAALREGLLIKDRLPASSVPANAVRSITADLGPLVMSAAVESGQLLLRPMLVPAAQATGGVAIPKGMVAVSLSFCLPEAVAGEVRAGSQVAVFDTYTTSRQQLTAQANCTGPHQQQGGGSVHTQVVLPKVLVLSVGAASTGSGTAGKLIGTAAGSSASGQNGILVTVAVNQADAQRLIQLTETGLPYLALLTPASQTKLDTSVPLLQSAP